MKGKEYYLQKYESSVEFDLAANAEEIVGYYLVYYEENPLECWLKNIDGINLTEKDNEVTRILKELENN